MEAGNFYRQVSSINWLFTLELSIFQAIHHEARKANTNYGDAIQDLVAVF
jgi:hypothetical protein